MLATLRDFLDDSFVTSTLNLIVSKYLILSNEDLEVWNDDPESFVQEEDSDHWEFNIRQCAEKLVTVLVSQNRHLLAPILIEVLRQTPEAIDLTSILQREAVYCAIGLAAYDVYEYMSFSEWVEAKLVTESQSTSIELSILRRRISWLIGKWISVKSPQFSRPILYQILIHLMRQNEASLVVRITAVSDLKLAIDDYEFVAEDFRPFVGAAIHLFVILMADCDSVETKMKILECLIAITERMESHIIPFVDPIIFILPKLWDRSDGDNIFRALIVATMTKLVISTGAQSKKLHDIVTPVIRQSLDTSQVK